MVAEASASPRILHCLADPETLQAERLPQRLARLGDGLDHTIAGVSEAHWREAQRKGAAPKVRFARDFPALQGRRMPGRLNRIAGTLKPFDLVLTYGYGALDVAMAHTLFSEAQGLPPLIHHESDLGVERDDLRKGRTWYRRIALGKAAGLVIPSEPLEEIALTAWQQPIGRVKRFAPGVELSAFAKRPSGDALRGIIKREGEYWIGASAREGEAHLFPLVKALADLPECWHLIVLEAHGKTDPLNEVAEDLDAGHRLHFLDPVNSRETAFGLLDIFADLTSGNDFPVGCALAMASGLPIVGWSGGERETLVVPENAAMLAPLGNESALHDCLCELAETRETRAAIGAANRAKAQEKLGIEAAIDRYRRLYASALGREIIA